MERRESSRGTAILNSQFSIYARFTGASRKRRDAPAMRLTVLLTVMLPALSFAGALTDAQLLEKVRQRATTMEEVTKEPQIMHGITATMCAQPPAALVAEEKGNPHLNKFARL